MDLGHGKKHRTVIQGEASESDDDDELDPSPLRANDARIPIPSYQELKTPMFKGIVVAGEASESDEEINTTDVNTSLPPLKVDKGIFGDDPSLNSSLMSSPLSRQRYQDAAQQPKYDTLLHAKLRDRNVALARHLRDAVKHVYVSATKDLNSNSQNLYKTQAAIQDVSHNMRLLTNDLFHIQDKIDIITTCNLLPTINIALPSNEN